MNHLPYEIFIGIFSEDQMGVRADYIPAPLWNNLGRLRSSSGRLRIAFFIETSQDVLSFFLG